MNNATDPLAVVHAYFSTMSVLQRRVPTVRGGGIYEIITQSAQVHVNDDIIAPPPDHAWLIVAVTAEPCPGYRLPPDAEGFSDRDQLDRDLGETTLLVNDHIVHRWRTIHLMDAWMRLQNPGLGALGKDLRDRLDAAAESVGADTDAAETAQHIRDATAALVQMQATVAGTLRIPEAVPSRTAVRLRGPSKVSGVAATIEMFVRRSLA